MNQSLSNIAKCVLATVLTILLFPMWILLFLTPVFGFLQEQGEWWKLTPLGYVFVLILSLAVLASSLKFLGVSTGYRVGTFVSVTIAYILIGTFL